MVKTKGAEVNVTSSNHSDQLDNLNVNKLEKALRVKTSNIGRFVTHINESAGEKFKKIFARFGHLLKFQWLNDDKCKLVIKNQFQKIEDGLRKYYSDQIVTEDGAKAYLESLQKGHQKLETIANLFNKTIIFDDVKKELHIKEWEDLIAQAKQKISTPPPPGPGTPPARPADKQPASDVIDTSAPLPEPDFPPPPPPGPDVPPPPPPPGSDIPPPPRPAPTDGVRRPVLPPLEPVVPLAAELINKIKTEINRKVPEEDREWDFNESFTCEDPGTEGCDVHFESDDVKSTLTISHPDGRKFMEVKKATGEIKVRNFAKDGYDENKRTAAGFDQEGFDEKGFDVKGYDREGYNDKGVDKDTYNRAGVNQYGFNRHTGKYETPPNPVIGTVTVDRAAEAALIKQVWDTLNANVDNLPLKIRARMTEFRAQPRAAEMLYDDLRQNHVKFVNEQNAPTGLFGAAGIKVPPLFIEDVK
ncbi:MAG: hypothetical protein CK425_08750 [Parachlamydia sp.]|nr:MAG: hypothetical protein CK425_08750 [Parachlamydia sp.]